MFFGAVKLLPAVKQGIVGSAGSSGVEWANIEGSVLSEAFALSQVRGRGVLKGTILLHCGVKQGRS